MTISLITLISSAIKSKLRAGMDCIFPDGSANAPTTNPIKAKGSIALKAQPTNPDSCKPKKTPRKHNKKKRGY